MPDETRATTEKPPRRREPMSPVELMALGAQMVLHGANPSQLGKKLSLPYAEAVKLHAALFEQVHGRLRERETPETQAALRQELKDDLREIKENSKLAVRRSFREGNYSTRAYTQALGAAKLLIQMEGFAAPVRTVNIDLTDRSLINPEVQARIMARPEARAALLALEEMAAEEQAVYEVRAGVLPEGGAP